MPPRSSKARPPRSFLRSGTWPLGVVSGPAYAQYAAVIAANLSKEIERRGLSLRETAAATGVDRQTISRTLAGETVPDLATLAALEVGLGRTLWPKTPLPADAET